MFSESLFVLIFKFTGIFSRLSAFKRDLASRVAFYKCRTRFELDFKKIGLNSERVEFLNLDSKSDSTIRLYNGFLREPAFNIDLL